MEIIDIHDKIDVLLNTINNITQNREIWQLRSKNVIIETLTEIINRDGLRNKVQWEIGQNINTTNLESVYLYFTTIMSGISGPVGETKKHFKKYGGVLTFSQVYNGRIKIVIDFPYIEECTLKSVSIFYTNIKPDDITRDFVILKVEKFIDEMIQWEAGNKGAF